MKKLVLSSRISIDKFNKINFIIDEDLSKFLNDLNAAIYPIIFKKKNIDIKSLKNSDGLILAGGGDLFKIKKNPVNKFRDQYEIKLFKYFLSKNKPILLICRGFQLVASFYESKLIKIKNHVNKKHFLQLKKNRFIKSSNLHVNSFHNFGLSKFHKDFNIISLSKDKFIEIAEHKSKNILCLMFHPERNMKSKKKILQSIKTFFS